ncbi:MAG: chemotaxis protein CheA, partial [Deltaproteobacteria bacterium]|nr:chemotaxis protein CheA [Deltaproteobacteria bacterium]
RIAEEMERLTGYLRDNTMSIRMLPISTTFSKFKPFVLDLSNELVNDVLFTTEGGETELDKTVIERLNDPLVHIIRNCIDHGIESPEKRRDKGKLGQGEIRLSAAHSGPNVLIRISDDGAGLDREAIRAKAIERCLLAPEVALSDSDVYSMIFAPGFSTAATITGVSGRGVGMDVVKRSVDTLRGTIELTSQRDRGTTITLKLPLTLAIIDGLLVEVSDAYFVLPLWVVKEVVELTRADLAEAHGKHIANVRGEIVPYVPLRDFFRMDGDPPSIEQIVIAEVDGSRVGFVVDHVIGGHQTVIKTLGTLYNNSREFSGATILADGTVALIVDAPVIVRQATDETIRNFG